jgi:type III pantothenate kinase
MKPDMVADVGNSRIKWGRCKDGSVATTMALPPDDPAAWQQSVEYWSRGLPLTWAVSGVHPERRDRLADWLRQRGDTVLVVDSWRQLPVQVFLAHPERVGIDRLLNAVAARDRVQRRVPVLIIDAGSAVTVDLVDETGAFRGGGIFPGMRLMAQALHDYTALLPLVEVRSTNPPLPGTLTEGAIAGGIFWAVAGGIKALVRQLAARGRELADPHHSGSPLHSVVVFLTGGDARLLAPVMDVEVQVWPTMTLEGIRLAAEALP